MNAHVTVTLTFYWWWLVAYLVVGVVLWLPLSWGAWKQISNPDPFWSEVRRTHWSSCVIQVAAWPLAIWEVSRWPLKKAWRALSDGGSE